MVEIKTIHFPIDVERYEKLVKAKGLSKHRKWADFFCNKVLGDDK